MEDSLAAGSDDDFFNEQILPVVVEPDLEGVDLDLITNEDFEALTRFFSHYPGLDQVFEDVQSDQAIHTPAPCAQPCERGADPSILKIPSLTDTPPDPETKTEPSSPVVPCVHSEATEMSHDLPVQIQSKQKCVYSPVACKHCVGQCQNSQAECSKNLVAVVDQEDTKDNNNYYKSSPASSASGLVNCNSFNSNQILKGIKCKALKWKTVNKPAVKSKGGIKRNNNKVIEIRPLARRPDKDEHVLTFRFSEEFPEFLKEVSLFPDSESDDDDGSTKLTSPSKGRRSLQNQDVRRPSSMPQKTKFPFIFQFSRRKNHHDMYCKQKHLVDRIEENNRSRSFFDILLTSRHGPKIICKRNNMLYLERHEATS